MVQFALSGFGAERGLGFKALKVLGYTTWGIFGFLQGLRRFRVCGFGIYTWDLGLSRSSSSWNLKTRFRV